MAEGTKPNLNNYQNGFNGLERCVDRWGRDLTQQQIQSYDYILMIKFFSLISTQQNSIPFI